MKKILFAILTVSIAFLASCNKKNEPETVGTVNDICGNTYEYVKIGEQYWMAENMRCNKYDSKSERNGVTLSTSEDAVYTPYYTDTSNKSLWNSKTYSSNLTDKQISQLGYLYNWAAAVGVENGLEQTSSFSGNRQGICPNGWHLPTDVEWDVLAKAVGGVKNEYGHFNNAGSKLKTTSGWYDNGNGTDEYSFSALPSGIATGSTIGIGDYGYTGGSWMCVVGGDASFWTATGYSDYAENRNLNCYYPGLLCDTYNKKYASSVRCVKD